MYFISAGNAKELVKEYEEQSAARFLAELSTRIEDAAHKGFSECYVKVNEIPRKDKDKIFAVVSEKGFEVEVVKRSFQNSAPDYYKIKW